jgi:hypothetical protein
VLLLSLALHVAIAAALVRLRAPMARPGRWSKSRSAGTTAACKRDRVAGGGDSAGRCEGAEFARELRGRDAVRVLGVKLTPSADARQRKSTAATAAKSADARQRKSTAATAAKSADVRPKDVAKATPQDAAFAPRKDIVNAQSEDTAQATATAANTTARAPANASATTAANTRARASAHAPTTAANTTAQAAANASATTSADSARTSSSMLALRDLPAAARANPSTEPTSQSPPAPQVDLFAAATVQRAAAVEVAAKPADRAWRPRRGVGGAGAAGDVDVASFLSEDAARQRVAKGAVAPELRQLERQLDSAFTPTFIQADVSDRAALFIKQMRGFWRNPPKTGELQRGIDPTQETYQDKLRSMHPERAFFLGRQVEV